MSKSISCPHCLGTGEIIKIIEENNEVKESCNICKGDGKVLEEVSIIYLQKLEAKVHDLLNDGYE